MRSREGLTILVPDGESHFSLPVLTCLGNGRGNRVHVISSEPSARTRFSRHTASFTAIQDPGDESRWRAVRRAIHRHRPDVVLPVCETGARLLARFADELRGVAAVPPIPDSLDIGDKWRLAQMLERLGIPHPATLLWTADVGFRKRIAALEFPVLIKPRHLSGGAGIRAFSDPITLVRFLEARPRRARRYVVQSFVPGRDVDVSALCHDGRVLAQTTQRPLAAARGYRPPTEIEMVEQPEALALATRMFTALEWSGVANVDLRVDDRDGRLCVIEVNPRYWSSLLASHAAGIDFPHLACRAALGETFPPPRQRPLRFLQARASLRAALRAVTERRWLGVPRLDETIWPYLLADPLPHAMGRFAGRTRPADPAPVTADLEKARAA